MPDQAALLRLRFTLTRSDIYRASFFDFIRKPIWYVIVAGSLMGIVQLPEKPVAIWILAVVVIGVIFFIVPYSAARTGMKNSDIVAPMNLVFTSSGISAEFERGTNSAAWALVKGASETKTFVFIFMQRGSFHLVPKAQISHGEIILLRDILRQNVATKVRLFTES